MIAGFEDAFPALRSEGFEETSPPSQKYNCIAWAAGSAAQWWWPYQHPAYYWPEGQTREVTLDAFLRAFVSLGFDTELMKVGAQPYQIDRVQSYLLIEVPPITDVLEPSLRTRLEALVETVA